MKNTDQSVAVFNLWRMHPVTTQQFSTCGTCTPGVSYGLRIWLAEAKVTRLNKTTNLLTDVLFISVLLAHLFCTRFAKGNIQAKGPDGKWTRKPLAYRESKEGATINLLQAINLLHNSK